MKTTHPIENSHIRVVDVMDDYSHVELHGFHVEDSQRGTIAGITCAGGPMVWNVEETRLIFGESCPDCGGLPESLRERYGLTYHSLFFAVYDRPPYVPLVHYVPDLGRFDREPGAEPDSGKPDSWIRITVLEKSDAEPAVSSTIFARPS